MLPDLLESGLSWLANYSKAAMCCQTDLMYDRAKFEAAGGIPEELAWHGD